MNIIRHLEFFNPIEVKEKVSIIGVGAVGSHVANNLARLGIKEITIYDFDNVEDHNIPNQMFFEDQIKMSKTESVKATLIRINPDIIVNIKNRYENEELKGHVFICVDSIDVRNKIYNDNKYNMDLITIFDTRIGLESGQVYSAIWNNPVHQKGIFDASDFKKEEVEVPVSACGSKLAVLTTVQLAATFATSNFINYLKTESLSNTILFNSFSFFTKSFKF